MINKKAILVKNVLSLTIAVIALLLLFAASYKIYKNATSNDEIENAQNTLDRLTQIINSLETGQSNNFTIQGFKNAESWHIVGWGKFSPENEKPESCFLTSCLYICKATASSWKRSCEKQGVFVKLSEDDIIIKNYEITNSKPTIPSDDFSAAAGKVENTLNIQTIPLKENLLKIEIEKNTDSEGKTYIKITHYENE